MSIETNVQSLSPGSIIDMYEVDTGDYGQGILRYCAHANEKGEDIIWQGNVFYRFPVKVEGYKKSSKGTLARPTMTLANVGGMFSSYLRIFNYFLGAKITRKRTFVKYLDATNFVSGVNGSADPNTMFPNESYFVDRLVSETLEFIVLELAVSWDVTGVKLPLRQVIRDTCQWQYRGDECGYTGAPVAQIDDTPTGSMSLDRCSKRMSGCKLRWGTNNPLPASFFPAVGLIK